jgi:hypothetical protein
MYLSLDLGRTNFLLAVLDFVALQFSHRRGIALKAGDE